MATTPFTAAFEASLKAPLQGGKLRLDDGIVVDPQFYCCISGNTVGVDKDPVPHLRVIPVEVCAGAPVVVYYNASWSPTSTISTWAIAWGDGQNSNGAWPGAGFIAHPLGGYVLPNTYTITLTVTDVLGASAAQEVQIIVNDCAGMMLPDAYLIVATDNGVYRTDYSYGGTMHWVLMDGIAAGTPVYDLCEDPQFSQYTVSKDDIRVYAAASDGLYYCDDPFGGGEWIRMVTLAQVQTICTLPAIPDEFSGVACCEELPGYLVAYGNDASLNAEFVLHTYVAPSTNPADYNGRGIGGWGVDIKGALTISRQVDVAGEPLCVSIGHGLRGLALLRHESDTSGPWIWYDNGAGLLHPHIWSYWEPNEGVLATASQDHNISYIRQMVGMIEWPWAVSTLRVGATGMDHVNWAAYPTLNKLIWSHVDDPALYVVDLNSIWIADVGTGYWYVYGPSILAIGFIPLSAKGDRERGFFISCDESFAVPGAEQIVWVTEGNVWTDITGDMIPGPVMGNCLLHLVLT